MLLKIHNREFNNWLYALLAYNEGRGGARKLLQQRYLGAKSMTVGKKAHVYIIHFLAYKIAFESVLGQNRHPELCLYDWLQFANRRLAALELAPRPSGRFLSRPEYQTQDAAPRHS